jgi:flagellar FliL protein
MAKTDDKDAKEETKKKGKGKLIIMVVPLVLLIAGAAWFLFLKPKDDGAAKELPPPVPGAVVKLDPITINLDNGHFLKLGLALQPIAGAHEEPDGSKALDIAIAMFSGKSIDDISSSEGREKAKEELVARVKLAYVPEHGGEEEHATEEKTAEGSDEESAKDSEEEPTDAAATEDHSETLTAEEAIKQAGELTVQPDIYDVYFTEFVYQ